MTVCGTLLAKTENGNELALQVTTAKGAEQKQLCANAVGNPYFFRYLQIREIQKGSTNGMECVRFSTQEPSSDLYVSFTVTKPDSLAKAAELKVGDAMAVTGRVRRIDPAAQSIVLEPVIVRYKDRLAPTPGKELLPDVDPNARYATETSSGQESVVRGKDRK